MPPEALTIEEERIMRLQQARQVAQTLAEEEESETLRQQPQQLISHGEAIFLMASAISIDLIQIFLDIAAGAFLAAAMYAGGIAGGAAGGATGAGMAAVLGRLGALIPHPLVRIIAIIIGGAAGGIAGFWGGSAVGAQIGLAVSMGLEIISRLISIVAFLLYLLWLKPKGYKAQTPSKLWTGGGLVKRSVLGLLVDFIPFINALAWTITIGSIIVSDRAKKYLPLASKKEPATV